MHEFEFIETRLFTQKDKTYHKLENGFNMCNLVDGIAAVIESPTNSFEPYIVHYAETFIIPDKCKEYTIRPLNENEEIKFINTQLEKSEIIRTAGNEFLIYLIGYNKNQINTYISKLSKEFEKLPYGFGAAIGYSMIEDEIKTVEDAINEASISMRNDKEQNYK